MNNVAVPIFLSFLIFSAHGCCHRKSDWNEYPHPELKFPGVEDYAVGQGSSAALSQLDLVIGATTGVIPGGGQFIGPILTVCTFLRDLISGAEDGLSKFIERHLAVATIANVKSKVYTIENRLRDVQSNMEQRSSYNIPLSIAMDKCEEILDKYATEWGPLFKGGSTLVSSPSLISFASIHSAVAALGWNQWPEKRSQILGQMDRLQSTLEKYRDAAIDKRLSYARTGALFRSTCDQDCYDRFSQVMPCASCDRVGCDAATVFNSAYELSLFERYRRELEDQYRDYFNRPINKLAEFRSRLRNQMG
ncbi:uncharacterized protein LOC110847690 [Folsomia candida]|uniref:uncharacterized protein LOC110847690 n=1 Tax=Folsomia candida TaxID=158441 RepID=UPI000B8FBFEC|nr:uncharacterized protein LOC110847690 [Folsomia candida]